MSANGIDDGSSFGFDQPVGASSAGDPELDLGSELPELSDAEIEAALDELDLDPSELDPELLGEMSVPAMTTSQLQQFLVALLVMGVLFLYQVQTTVYIAQKLKRSGRKLVWIYMMVLSFLLIFYLFCITYGAFYLIINGFAVIPWWVLVFPTAIEILTTFSLAILRIMRVRMACQFTPILFWGFTLGVLFPIGVMCVASFIANTLWIFELLSFGYITEMEWLHPWFWEVGMMIASMIADAAFLVNVGLATSRTEVYGGKPQLSFRTTALIVLHIVLSIFFVVQVFTLDSAFGFMTYYISIAAFPVDQRAFLEINKQVSQWFYGEKSTTSQGMVRPSGWGGTAAGTKKDAASFDVKSGRGFGHSIHSRGSAMVA